MNKIFLCTLILVLIVFASCVGSKKNSAPSKAVDDIPEALVYYGTNVKVIINQKCNRCHAGRDNAYESLTDAAGLNKVKNMIETDKMPKGNPLPADEKEKVLKWIEIALK